MNSLPKYLVDHSQQAINLSGLEAFLEQPHVEPVPVEETETQMILRLLDQLYKVGELVRETSEKLVAANERLNSLSSLVTMQNKQMELLTHYQTQAARVGGLEHSLAMATAENERLKQAWWRKIFFWIK